MRKLFFIFAIVGFVSCKPTKTIILKNQFVYNIERAAPTNDPNAPAGYVLSRYKTTKFSQVKFSEDAGIQKISDKLPSSTLSDSKTIPFLDVSIDQYNKIGRFYFPEDRILKQTDANYVSKIKYIESSVVFQAITFALKLRPKIDIADKIDSFPATAETGLNVGFTIGRKYSLNSISTTKNIFGDKTSRLFSITPGAFLNFGATELNKANIRNSSLLVSRKVPTVSFGGFLSFGYYRFNVGYGLGIDFAIGPYSKRWIYQGFAHSKSPWLWHGIMISMDLK